MRDSIQFGDGMYKTIDGGKTWQHIGLENTRQIGRVIIDPKNPNIVFVAALGHAYGPNSDRGVYRSRDGGATWQKVLFKNADVGAIDLNFDPTNSRIVYATMWNVRRPPWFIYAPANGPGGGIFKSIDGGTTWKEIDEGIPVEGRGRIGISVSPANSNRIYVSVDAKEGGIFRSDDAGLTWTRLSSDKRLWDRGWYFEKITVDPGNADVVYVMNTSTYRSTDAGKTWTAIKGAPGGDDYHQLWIYPDDPNRMVLASDQGAIVTVDGAQTWSSWYNQSTAQLYHVAADYRFPYWLTGPQQDSGAAAVPSRSSHSEISNHDWTGTCAGGESGYTAPDPLHPEILFGGTVARCNVVTGESKNVSPERGGQPGQFRHAWTQPLVFSVADPHALYYANQFLYKTTNGGESWTQISQDMTREDPGVPSNLNEAAAANAPKEKRRGVIYTIAPSPLRASMIWIGTDDGLIHLTNDDGKSWQNVTPPALTPWSKVTHIEASRHDANTVYAAVDRHRLEDYAAYLYRTHDSGKTWERASRGIPDGSFLNCIREDPVRKGLLYACTELGVYVSFNEGDDWQPLQLNLPVVSVRDLVVHGDDLVIATHGRSLWILDDVTPLRQYSAEVSAADAWLFRPQTAYRVPPGSDQGTPFPPEEPQAENPPNGAIVDYFLKAGAAGPVTLEILDGDGKLVRRYSSEDAPAKVDPNSLDIPMYWIHPAEPLSAKAGMHRFVWDLRYSAPPGMRGRRGSSAGALTLPGAYTVKLTVAGHSF